VLGAGWRGVYRRKVYAVREDTVIILSAIAALFVAVCWAVWRVSRMECGLRFGWWFDLRLGRKEGGKK
jgi:hypothetical protein